MNFPLSYFPWLQQGNPTGSVERFPELTHNYETSVAGVYCVGDLTGVPLINLAASSGNDIIERLAVDATFQKQRSQKKDNTFDVVIIGAGPAGIAAALAAKEKGFHFQVLEAIRPFATIHNFPAQKPIHIVEAPHAKSALTFDSDTKETLLEELDISISAQSLPIATSQSVHSIAKEANEFTVSSQTEKWKALRVIVAIGKSGNPRRLDVAGEHLPKLYSRLIDATNHQQQDILVVGGGDSALEAAIALCNEGNRVSVSYRGGNFTRPKASNIKRLQELQKENKVNVIFESNVVRIEPDQVIVQTPKGETTLPNQAVFSLIGTEIPISFFERSNIRIENERRFYDHLVLVTLVLFSCVLYFGKSAPATPVTSVADFFSLPAQLVTFPIHKMVKGMIAWLSFIGLLGSALLLVGIQVKKRSLFNSGWATFKWMYFACMALLFAGLYVQNNLRGSPIWDVGTSTWYTGMYSLTILIFGLRRMKMHPTSYIQKQTWTLIAIQFIPLFVLPLFVLPWLGGHGYLSDWVMTNVFPNESYWRAFGFILGWPLFLYNLASGQPYLFWLIFSILQTFVIIPLLVFHYGKGAYCGWICSCGALAETLGDEYRNRAPHGPRMKKLENAGQIVLWIAALITLLTILRVWLGVSVPGATVLNNIYAIIVDIIFAGVLGVGVYFSYSGRIWCRFLCPLAALMHLYARFTLYRIFADKNRCISCGICTKVCHMGIDVMGFAATGTPMNDVECVRCSACVVNCPMDVLSFGKQAKIDLQNTLHKMKT